MTIEKAPPGGVLPLSTVQSAFLALLRIAIGWHFAYEGLSKVLDPGWSSAAYLESASWVGSGMFHWMASDPAILRVVDLLNAWGLLLVGAPA